MTPQRSRAPGLRAGLALVAMLAIATPFLAHERATRRSAALRTYTPPPLRPRLAWTRLRDAELGDIEDFTRIGDRLYLLDRQLRQIVVLRPDSGGWRGERTFGRPGDGPGELRRPAAITALPAGAGIAILEVDGRVTRFSPLGTVLGVDRWSMPCVAFEPALAFGPGHRRFLAANCHPTGGADRDTIHARLFTSSNAGASFHEIARAPRMATDLSWGTTFSTEHLLSDSEDSLLFSTGLDGCAVTLRKTADSPPLPALARCTLADTRFSAPPPAAFAAERRQARRRGGPRAAPAFDWPDTLPAFLGAASAADTTWLVRPVSGDTVVVVPAGGFHERTIGLVAPLDGFVACTRGTCLWIDHERSRIAVFAPPHLP